MQLGLIGMGEGPCFPDVAVGVCGYCFFLLRRGFWPQELRSLWLSVNPVIVGTKEDMVGYIKKNGLMGKFIWNRWVSLDELKNSL